MDVEDESLRFVLDVNSKMHVPDQIILTTGTPEMTNGFMNGISHSHMDMRVPDKIVLAGQERHVSSRGKPRELDLENAMMPVDQAISIQTPPRVITLNEQTYRVVEDDVEEKVIVKSEKVTRCEKTDIMPMVSRENSLTRSQSAASLSGISEGNFGEELDNLRRQVSRMNRRLMSLEIENQQRQNRELVIYSLGLAYFVVKALLWLNRS